MTFLFTSESTSGWASLRAAMASALLPGERASFTLRKAVRMRERNAMLRVRLVSARRAAFSADFVFATQGLQQFRAFERARSVLTGPHLVNASGIVRGLRTFSFIFRVFAG